MNLHPEVLAAMAAVARRGGNPASQHRLGQAARRDVDAAAQAVAACVGLPGAQVVFVRDVAEAHVLALVQLAASSAAPVYWRDRGNDAAFAAAAALLAALGVAVQAAPAGVTANAAGPHLAPGVLGWVLGPRDPQGAWGPEDAAALALTRTAGWAVHVDASAAFGGDAAAHGTILAWPAAGAPRSVALAGTSVGGPPGVAALIGQPAPERPGTVPRELAVGLGAAARRLANGG